jgi:hypothetical protein
MLLMATRALAAVYSPVLIKVIKVIKVIFYSVQMAGQVSLCYLLMEDGRIDAVLQQYCYYLSLLNE